MIDQHIFATHILPTLNQYISPNINLYFALVSEKNRVVEINFEDEVIVISGNEYAIKLNYKDFLNNNYEEILSKFLILTSVNTIEKLDLVNNYNE